MPRTRIRQGDKLDVNRIYRAAREDVHGALAEKFEQHAARSRRARATQRRAESTAHGALGRLLREDRRYATSIERIVQGSDRPLARLRPAGEDRAGGLSKEHALELVSGTGIQGITADQLSAVAFALRKDTSVDIYTAPYADSWTTTSGGALQHQQMDAWADKSNGRFGFLYTIGKEGGGIYCGAAVWVRFMRKAPGVPPGWGTTGLAQVRTRTRYRYAWNDLSYLATAHQHAGFGVFVVSWDLNGGSNRVDQDHEYWTWSDGTSWYDHHHNPSWSGFDSDLALSFQDQAPYFTIEPGRMYAAAIWCFGEGDASGASIVDASYAQAVVDATADFVVVGQQ
jgi:hypothetical protein